MIDGNSQDTTATADCEGSRSCGDTVVARPAISLHDDFDWSPDNTDVIIFEQRDTAVYTNAAGQIVIRQRRDCDDETDQAVIVSRQNIPTLIDRLRAVMGSEMNP